MKQPGSNSIMTLSKFRLSRILSNRLKEKPIHQRTRGWRLYQGKQFLKSYKHRADAVKAKAHAEAQGQSGAGHGCRPKPTSKYVGVHVAEAGRGKWKFVASVKYGRRIVHLGTCNNQADAAKLVAAFTERSLKDLRVAKEIMDPSGSMARFRRVAAIFKGWIPADIKSAVEMRKDVEDGHMMGLAPGIFVGALLGKEHHWRKCVLHAWGILPLQRQLQMAGFETTNTIMQAEAAHVMYDVFRNSFVTYANTACDQEREWWSLHVNRNVQHHHSLIPWALGYKLLQKQGRKQATSVLWNKAHWFCFVGFDAKVHAAPMLKLHRLGRSTQCLNVPRTNAQWLSEFRAARTRAQQYKLNHEGYHWDWLVRTRLVVEMRNAGIKRLSVDVDWDSDQVVQAMLPDQSDWLQMWMTKTNNSLKQLLKALDFKEPLEMLSCFACVLGDISLHDASIDQTTCNQIREARKTMLSSWGFEGNPALIVQGVIHSSST